MQIDLYNRTAVVEAVRADDYNEGYNGPEIDLQGYNAALIAVAFGSWTDGTLTVVLESRPDTDADWAAVDDDDIVGNQPTVADAGGAEQVYSFGYRGNHRYIRVTLDETDVTAAIAASGVAVLGHGRRQAVE